MRIRDLALTGVVVVATGGCAGSVADLDTLSPGAGGSAAATAVTSASASLTDDTSFAAGADVVPLPEPASALDAFRALEIPCAQYAALAGRGDDDHPRVEPDRFAGAVAVRDLGPATTLIEDGRGTPLVLAGWDVGGTLLAGSGRPDDPLPDPYRLGCPPNPTVEQPQEAWPAPGG